MIILSSVPNDFDIKNIKSDKNKKDLALRDLSKKNNSKLKTFQVSFPSEFSMMKTPVDRALQFIDDNNPSLDKNIRGDVKLVINELVANAISHGNKKNKDKKVYLRVKLKKDFIIANIADEGKGFNYRNYFSGEYPSDKSQMKESGRGIRLACSLMDSVDFNSLGNEVKFLKKVNPSGQNPNC